MSTATKPQQPKTNGGAPPQQPPKPSEPIETRSVSFVPFMGKEQITLTIAMVQQYIAKPTKSGKMPTVRDIMGFIMLCKARGLNPWENDAFLIGYDEGESATFSLITSHQALLKRAEVHPEYLGMKSGVIVRAKTGEIVNRNGAFYLEDDVLLGAWAEVHKQGKLPTERTIKLTAFNKGYSRWKVDPGGLIVKCAEASALRQAFPNTLGGMYLADEMDDMPGTDAPKTERASSLAALTARLTQQPTTTFVASKEPQGEYVPRREAAPMDIGNLEEVPNEPTGQEEGRDHGQDDVNQDPPEADTLATLRRLLAECRDTTALNALSTTWIGPDSQLDQDLMTIASDLLDVKRKELEAASKPKGGRQKELA